MVCSLYFCDMKGRPHVRPWILYFKTGSLADAATWVMGVKMVPTMKRQGAGLPEESNPGFVNQIISLCVMSLFVYNSYRSLAFRKAYI